MLCISGLTAISVFETPFGFVGNTSGATTLYVNTTGSGGGYTSVRAAVENASQGDEVVVYSGEYYEDTIEINKTITLKGQTSHVYHN